MNVLETERLALRRLTEEDAGFILDLLNEPSFLQFIGDRGVRGVEAAREYLRNGPLASYERHGFGLFLTVLKAGGVPIGFCGLLRRDGLDDVDVGYALLPRYWSQGYASEAAAAVLAYGRETLGLQRIVAITATDNVRSIRVLEKLGLKFERLVRLAEGEPEISLFATVD